MQGSESTAANEASKNRPKLSPYLRVMRPKQWTKNLIAFAPLIFAAKVHVPTLFQSACLCVVSFCLLSSSIYIINDILDKEADKLHPTKSKRPIAAGEISVASAWLMAIILAPSALLLGFMIRPALILVLFAYLVLTVSYSLVLKHAAILDVLSIAAGFLLRAVAGAVAVRVPMSGWFLLCTGLGAVYLALEKRRREISLLQNSADAHRKALQGYSIALLDRFESLILPSLLTSYVFYSFLSIHGQWMMLTVPFVIYGLMRYQQLSSAENSITGTPEEVLLKDRSIQVAVLLWLITSTSVVYGQLQAFLYMAVRGLDSLVH
ncbi:MAG: decaprenyl-phosphate phosphoribosyltransferase [Candidatus Obscuribacterales bacterium]|nr:decaprenyl-phosphate phosphoribosyltransferase [Candidatus Obscuribacterales bacterium]